MLPRQAPPRKQTIPQYCDDFQCLSWVTGNGDTHSNGDTQQRPGHSGRWSGGTMQCLSRECRECLQCLSWENTLSSELAVGAHEHLRERCYPGKRHPGSRLFRSTVTTFNACPGNSGNAGMECGSRSVEWILRLGWKESSAGRIALLKPEFRQDALWRESQHC